VSAFGRLDERLREIATDTGSVGAAAAAARAALSAEREPIARGRLLGHLGNTLRLLGRHAEAAAAQRRGAPLP
jgi:hypothetical protein